MNVFTVWSWDVVKIGALPKTVDSWKKKKQPERMKLQAALSVETDHGDDADVVTEEPITR